MKQNCLADRLLSLINGYRLSQALYVVATLGIPDLLRSGPLGSEELARATGTNRAAMERVLRALAAVDILSEGEAGFALTELGEGLRSDVPNSRNAWAKFVASPPMWAAWSALLHTVQTGENAFAHIHGVSTWHYRAENPEASAIFDAAMRENSRVLVEHLLRGVDFGGFAHLIDVGGGDGALLAGILARYPQAKGTLLDLPHVATKADAVLADAGVRDRARVVGGNFFDSVPNGGDCYLLKNVLHDWQDAEAVSILHQCRRAMTSNATLVLVERILDQPVDIDTSLSDLNMLVNAGGRERSLDEFSELLTQTDFMLTRVIPIHGPRHAIEALPCT